MHTRQGTVNTTWGGGDRGGGVGWGGLENDWVVNERNLFIICSLFLVRLKNGPAEMDRVSLRRKPNFVVTHSRFGSK